MRFDHRIFYSEADTVSLSYTTCYVRLTRHCHDTFTNMLVYFFISESMKAVNPFLDRMPRELHEEYMTDCLKELMKMAETNKTTDDGGVSLKHGLIVAFARKS